MDKSFARLPDISEMRAIDVDTIDAGIPAIQLMRNAGRESYLQLIKRFGRQISALRIVILCGPGNNGGDGLSIAGEFIKDGIFPKIIIAAAKKYSGDFILQLQELCRLDAKVFFYPSGNILFGHQLINKKEFDALVSQADILIDALLGNGQANKPREPILDFLKAAHRNKKAIKISIDTPTGANPGTGKVVTPYAFKADESYVIELVKRGQLQSPLRDLCGKIKVISIGLSSKKGSHFNLALPYALLPSKRDYNHHKGTTPRVFVIGGSQRFPGAPVLAAEAALKAGAGIVIKISPENKTVKIIPEVIQINLPGKHLISKHVSLLNKETSDYFAGIGTDDILAIGPGMGRNKLSLGFLNKFLQLPNQKVIDADALNLISQQSDKALKSICFANSVITPHPQEAARLLRCSVSKVQSDRYCAAERLFDKFGAVTVLKGAGSIIYGKSGGFVNTTGNPYMGTAGSGDVLTGIISALLAQGLNPEGAALSGVVLHGLAGDLAVLENGGVIIAGDIPNCYPEAVMELLRIQDQKDQLLWQEELINHSLCWPPE